MDLECKEVFLALATPYIERAVHFYRVLFAIAPTQEVPGVYAEFSLPGLKLGLFSPKATHLHEFAQGRGAMSLCLEVSHLEAAIAQVAAAYTDLPEGDRVSPLPVGEMIVASHGREVYAYDPDGNRLILHEARS